MTTQVQRLNDPAFIATTATAPIPTTEELQVSDPDLERVEVAIGELKSKVSREKGIVGMPKDCLTRGHVRRQWKENESQRGSGRSNPNSMLGLQAEDTLQRFVDRWLEGAFVLESTMVRHRHLMYFPRRRIYRSNQHPECKCTLRIHKR